MGARFVHLGLNPVGAAAHISGTEWPADFNGILQRHLDRVATDWYRYASQNYVLWTTIGLDELARSISALPGFQNVYVFATEFAPPEGVSFNGWMPPKFWQWVRKPRI
jgi:hypothetical protein